MSLRSTRGVVDWSHRRRQKSEFRFLDLSRIDSRGDLIEDATSKISRNAKITGDDYIWQSFHRMIDEEDKEVARGFLSLSKFRNPSRAESESYAWEHSSGGGGGVDGGGDAFVQ